MNNCKKCGNILNPGDVFCQKCGEKIINPQQNNMQGNGNMNYGFNQMPQNNMYGNQTFMMNSQNGMENDVNNNQQNLNYQNMNSSSNSFQPVNNNDNNDSSEKEKDGKKISPIITIIIGIVCFAASYFLVRTLFSNNNSRANSAKYDDIDIIDTNGNTIEDDDKSIIPDNSDTNSETKQNTITGESVQLGNLKITVPSYFQQYDKTSQYIIYKSSDDICYLSILTTGSNVHANTNVLIDSMLNGAATSTKGTIDPYNITTKNINSLSWSYTLALLHAGGFTFYEHIYAILKDNNYYAIQYQNYDNSSTCEKYRETIINSLNFN